MCNQIDTGQQQGQSHPEHDYTDTDNRIEQNEKRGNNHENTQRHRPAGALDTHTHHLAGDADGHESPEEEPKAEHERQDREEHRRGAQQQDTQQDFDYTACDVPSHARPGGSLRTQIQFESARENHDDPEQHGKREISAARLEKDDDAHDEENNTEQHGELPIVDGVSESTDIINFICHNNTNLT